MRLLSASVLMLSFTLPAFAQVYQCKDASGKIRYADHACTPAESGQLIERQRSEAEIQRDRMEAAEASERKYRQQAFEAQQRQLDTQQRMLDQQSARTSAPPPSQASTQECKDARKDLEFISSIRTLSDTEKRSRMNGAIGRTNASCGTQMPLLQEPKQTVIVAPPGHSAPVR